MAGGVSRGALGLFVVSMTTGLTVGCGSDSCEVSCITPNAEIRVEGLRTAASATLCIDDDCRDLEESAGGRFTGFDSDIPSGEAEIEATVKDSSGAVVATWSERRTPTDPPCCDPYIALVVEDDELVWREW